MSTRGICLVVALAGVVAASGAAAATRSAQTRAGLDALARGDNETAARLFTDVLLYGGPTRPDRELAYVKRAEAFLALGRAADAEADARRAITLDPHDAEALAVRDKAASARAPAAPPAKPSAAPGDPSDVLNAKIKANLDAVAARNKAAFDQYQADEAAYEAQKAAIAVKIHADQDAYAASLAARDARVQAQKDRHAAEMEAWRRRVAACAHGEYSQCGQ